MCEYLLVYTMVCDYVRVARMRYNSDLSNCDNKNDNRHKIDGRSNSE